MAGLDATRGRRGVRRLSRANGDAGLPKHPGQSRAWILRHNDGQRTEFVTLTFWESLEAIRRFAGDNVELAVFYDEDDHFLREEKVTHWQID
ncbi:MAG: hypothetical protein ACJ757_02340 [Gaiellaceae bacterium]